MSQAPSKLSRRTLFIGASTVGTAAAVVGLLPSVAPSTPEVNAKRPAPERGGGYSLTEHVKRYYKTTLV